MLSVDKIWILCVCTVLNVLMSIMKCVICCHFNVNMSIVLLSHFGFWSLLLTKKNVIILYVTLYRPSSWWPDHYKFWLSYSSKYSKCSRWPKLFFGEIFYFNHMVENMVEWQTYEPYKHLGLSTAYNLCNVSGTSQRTYFIHNSDFRQMF